MPSWLLAVLSAATGAIIASLLSWLQQKARRRAERREAVVRLRYELQSNLRWLDDLPEARNYLRDDVWVAMMIKGYVAYAAAPIQMQAIETHNQMYAVNEHTRVVREREQEPEPGRAAADIDAKGHEDELRASIRRLISLLDAEYPRIGENL
jgi:hypothetical protein